jgi:hypothetical protein
MKRYGWLMGLLVMTVALAAAPTSASAQCGGGDHSSMHQEHMNSSGNMGSGSQMGMYSTQAPVQPDPNTVAPGYVAPAPPASGYSDPQNTGSSGQMMGRGGAGSGHSGHAGH